MHLLLEPLMRLFAALVSHGGAPRPDRNRFGEPVLLFPLRPGTLVFFLGSFLFFLYTLVVNVPLLLHHGIRSVHPWQLPLGLFLGAISVLMLGRRLTVEDSGLRLHRTFAPDLFLPWDELHHLERYNSTSAGKATFFFRSNPDPRTGRETTITLPEMTYNVDQLLREIRTHVDLPELPHRRRHWYGG